MCLSIPDTLCFMFGGRFYQQFITLSAERRYLLGGLPACYCLVGIHFNLYKEKRVLW